MKRKILKSSVSIVTVCTLSTTMVFANGINENIVHAKDIIAEEFLKETQALNTKSIDGKNIVSSDSEFRDALNNAEDGDSIIITGEVKLDTNLTINKSVTIQGENNAVIIGAPIYIGKNADVTINNITFDTPGSKENGKASAIYAEYLNSKLSINGCKFIDTQWDSLQLLPVSGAEIVIENCVFDTTENLSGANGNKCERYIHIESTQKDSNNNRITQDNVKIRIVGNTFRHLEKTRNDSIDIDYVNFDNVEVGKNKVEDSSISLKDKVYAINNNGLLDSAHLANNILSTEIVKLNDNMGHVIEEGKCSICGKEVSTFTVSSDSEFRDALNKAEAGDSIIITGEVKLDTNLTINKSVTIQGENNAIITGAPIYIGKNADVTINNITFDTPGSKENGKASAIYAEYLNSKLSINGCKFIDTQWDSLQLLPVSGAEIVIENCVFDTTENLSGANGNKCERYIHIESTQKDSNNNRITQDNVKIRIVGNTFRHLEKTRNDSIDIDYVNFDNVEVGQNKVEDSSISLKDKVYAVNNNGLLNSEHLANNILSSTIVQLNYNMEHIDEGRCPGCGKLDSEFTDSLIGGIESIIGSDKIEGTGTGLNPIVISLDGITENEEVNNIVEQIETIVEELSNNFEEYDLEILDNNDSNYIIYRIKFNGENKTDSTNEASSFIDIKVEKSNKNLIQKLDKVFSSTSVEFNDIKGHWAEETIKLFTDKKLVNGYEDNTFKPDKSMTRAEFVSVVNKVFGYTEKGVEEFTDVNENDWFYKDICIGIKEGYINGKSKDIFAPNDAITRQEAAMILTNIMNNKDENLDKLNMFKDGDKTAKWAQSSVEGAIEAGYLSGYEDETIRANFDITRAEAISMLSRVQK